MALSGAGLLPVAGLPEALAGSKQQHIQGSDLDIEEPGALLAAAVLQ
jgi:hypothetical protein